MAKQTDYVVSSDLLDYANGHDCDEAEVLLDLNESETATPREVYDAAKAYFEKLVADDTLEEEDRDVYLNPLPESDETGDGTVMDDTMKAIDGAADVDDLANAIADANADEI